MSAINLGLSSRAPSSIPIQNKTRPRNYGQEPNIWWKAQFLSAMHCSVPRESRRCLSTSWGNAMKGHVWAHSKGGQYLPPLPKLPTRYGPSIYTPSSHWLRSWLSKWATKKRCSSFCRGVISVSLRPRRSLEGPKFDYPLCPHLKPLWEYSPSPFSSGDHKKTSALRGCTTKAFCTQKPGMIEVANGAFKENVTRVDCYPASPKPSQQV